MNRTPPTDVRRALRQEVGYGCPVVLDGARCGRPYLEWHHFDPPWADKQHHDPRGMIALCTSCHPVADAGTFTTEQLHEFKLSAAATNQDVSGRFSWLRREMAIASGTNVFFENKIAVAIGGEPAIWFNRDSDGHALLNVKLPRDDSTTQTVIEDNFWVQRGEVTDLVCPPSGKLLDVTYRGGDRLRIEFVQATADELIKRCPAAAMLNPEQLQATFVEVVLAVKGLGLTFNSRAMHIRGSMITNCVMAHGYIGISIGR